MEYRSQMVAGQREIREREAGMDRQTMALHHAEQEVVRLQCLLDAAAHVAPSACKAVLAMAPKFDFAARGLEVRRQAGRQAGAMALHDAQKKWYVGVAGIRG